MTTALTTPPDAATYPAPSLDVAPGSVVRVRDEDWLVTQVSTTSDGMLLTVQGLSELAPRSRRLTPTTSASRPKARYLKEPTYLSLEPSFPLP